MAKNGVRELTLERGVHSDSTIYKLHQNNRLRFRIGASLLGAEVRLFTNYPINGEFQRETYYELEWSFSSVNDRTSYYADVPVSIAGSFIFYHTDSDCEKPGPSEAVGSGFYLVNPELSCGGKPVPLDSIVCQTVLSKLLGPIEQWMDRLLPAANCGYNMIHFTPIQALGKSNSAYSLANQHGLNVAFSGGKQVASFPKVDELLTELREKHNILSICDIVLNHTANETEWLAEHPSATYNLVNSPHLKPAFLLDRAIARLAIDIGEGKWTDRGIPKGIVQTVEQLEACRALLADHYIPQLKLDELFLVDIESHVTEFTRRKSAGAGNIADVSSQTLKIVPDPDYQRRKSSVDLDLAVQLFASEANFRDHLTLLNRARAEEVSLHLRVAVDNVIKGASYERLDSAGPKRTSCDVDNEFVAPYFTCPTTDDDSSMKSLAEEMELMYECGFASLCMAHNGWVMGDDPLRNFALPPTNPGAIGNVYLRRELVAWGDSVKLRYGDSPADSPFLWSYMREYTQQTARLFDGIRLDNCHSTPLHVAAAMLDAARCVRPDLYVVAELFTGSEEKDNIFVNNLGLTSLIREGLSAWDSHELGRLVYKYGGSPVGAFSLSTAVEDNDDIGGGAALSGQVAHALFLDWTHDNPSPAEKRPIEDMLPSAGLVAMASCAVGSNRGYDELVPHHIHVVDETRGYATTSELNGDGDVEVAGMQRARLELARLHERLALEGYTEVFVDQKTIDIVAVTRHCPRSRRSVILVAHNKFTNNSSPSHNTAMDVEGELDAVLLEAKMVKRGDVNGEFTKRADFINGCVDWYAEVTTSSDGDPLTLVEVSSTAANPGKIHVDLGRLVPGSLVVIAVKPVQTHRSALEELESLDFGHLKCIVDKLDLEDIHFALYQCNQEGLEIGFGAYRIPELAELHYCGLAGIVPMLNKIAATNDLGHPMAANLRAGNWLMDYTASRLVSRAGTYDLGRWVEAAFKNVAQLPRYLVPRYFHKVINRVYSFVDRHSFSLMSPFVQKGSALVESLARAATIHLAAVASAPLPPLSSQLVPPPRTTLRTGTVNGGGATLAAGLPHFSTGYMRSWGRDTFISMRGLLLTTGQFLAARDIILGYASCLRHGLIPNLLDGGQNARFNCRDAVWWWIRAILDYIEVKEQGQKILLDPVHRLFPSDVQADPRGRKIQLLQDVINEAIVKHWNGVEFREWNAGKRIDEHMKNDGFCNQIGTDKTTGFVYGGNVSNCGTWMDKMGSSEVAGNKGVPTTPRDGSAVEIVGLSYSCLRTLANLSCYPHQKIKAEDGQVITLAQWADKIKQNFEKYFWIGGEQGAEVEPNPELVNCTNMYKDSVNSGHKYTDYQLRPNYAIALAVAPDLVEPGRGMAGLRTMMTRLLGPLGLATLDPKDWAYRGDYDNSNQSDDPSVAHGANYHQGPEWVWPVGFLLRALIKIAALEGDQPLKEAKQLVFRILANHYTHLSTSDWLGLPELTNSKGQFCRDSNPIQAWSHATLLDTLYDIDRL